MDCEGEPDTGHGVRFAQVRKSVVVVAGTIADTVAVAIEREQRHDQDVGLNLGCLGAGLADAPHASDQRLAWAPGPHDQRLALSGDHRQRELGSPGCKLV